MSSTSTPRFSWLWLLIAQWFGSGRAPRAPGTVGSLAAFPLAYGLGHLAPGVYVSVTIALLLVGTFAAERASVILNEKDPSSVVIDEVLGVLLAHLFVCQEAFWAQGLAWLLFRFFDIKKPGPIYKVQFMRPAGVGIMADDVLAGLVAGILARGAALGVALVLKN